MVLDEVPVPLLMKKRALLTDFSVTDENGVFLATLTAGELRPIMAEVLFAIAESTLDTHNTLGAGLDPQIKSALLSIVDNVDCARREQHSVRDQQRGWVSWRVPPMGRMSCRPASPSLAGRGVPRAQLVHFQGRSDPGRVAGSKAMHPPRWQNQLTALRVSSVAAR